MSEGLILDNPGFAKIEKGLIGPVESVLRQVPYGMDSGWSTWEDAMSSRRRWQ